MYSIEGDKKSNRINVVIMAVGFWKRVCGRLSGSGHEITIIKYGGKGRGGKRCRCSVWYMRRLLRSRGRRWMRNDGWGRE